jgi:hypothetical protein
VVGFILVSCDLGPGDITSSARADSRCSSCPLHLDPVCKAWYPSDRPWCISLADRAVSWITNHTSVQSHDQIDPRAQCCSPRKIVSRSSHSRISSRPDCVASMLDSRQAIVACRRASSSGHPTNDKQRTKTWSLQSRNQIPCPHTQEMSMTMHPSWCNAPRTRLRRSSSPRSTSMSFPSCV